MNGVLSHLVQISVVIEIKLVFMNNFFIFSSKVIRNFVTNFIELLRLGGENLGSSDAMNFMNSGSSTIEIGTFVPPRNNANALALEMYSVDFFKYGLFAPKHCANVG